MKISKEKYLLARAKACMGTKDLVAAGIPRGTLSRVCVEKLDQKQPERLPRSWALR